MEEIIDRVVNEILDMDDGASSSIAILVGDGVEDKDMFEIQKKVEEQLLNRNIVLDYSQYDGMFVGLPFNLTFVKKTKNEIL